METSTEQASGTGGRAGQASTFEELRPPQAADGVRVHDLIARCAPLDENSLYCNLLQCSHFAQTCVVAESGGIIVGWVSGYVRPDRPDRLFIWQVAVAPEARGTGLGGRMIREILARDSCRNVTGIHTTITATNTASWSLFRKLAADIDASFSERVAFKSDVHFAGRNPTEYLVEIGPFLSGQHRR